MSLLSLLVPQEDGTLTPAAHHQVEVEARVYEVSFAVAHAACAQSASLSAGGQWWASSSGVVNVCGSRVTYYLTPAARLAAERARAALTDLGVVPGWTLSGCAKRLLAWVQPPARERSCSRRYLAGSLWGYHRLLPGTYPHLTVYDLDGAYWQVLCRLPSLAVDWLSGGPCFHPPKAPYRGRLDALKVRLAGEKALRNVVWGCMVGGGQRGVVFCRGERLKVGKPRGPFPTAGRLVARTVYEITGEVAETANAPLAHTDCVALPPSETPRLWARLGYGFGVRAAGEADLCNLGSFKVGSRQTVLYGRGSRYVLPAVRSALPCPLSYPYWH
jgi:hypothetical protein